MFWNFIHHLLFGEPTPKKKVKQPITPSSPEWTFQDTTRAFQDSVIVTATKAINRPLTEEEVAGIRRIHSPMMLESIEIEWECAGQKHPNYCTAEAVEKGLKYWADKKEVFKI